MMGRRGALISQCRLLFFWLLVTWSYIILKLTLDDTQPDSTITQLIPDVSYVRDMEELTENSAEISTENCEEEIRQKLNASLGQSTPHLNCWNLLAGNQKSVNDGVEFIKNNPRANPSDSDMASITENCAKFKNKRKYITKISTEEAQFPIAYSIVVHTFAHQVERLLRAIYRPHNLYCIHVDQKSSSLFQKAMANLASCFNNVFLPPKQETVAYASISRLQADINCMEELIRSKIQWKYLINLAGTSFPLKTNLEIVKILKTYNGSNDIEGMSGNKVFKERVKFKWKLNKRNRLVRTSEAKNPPPGSLEIVKGSAFGAFTRNFLEYVLSLPLSKAFLEWSRDTNSPDEHYWATLHHLSVNPKLQSPGGYIGNPNTKPWLMAYSKWQKVEPCKGKFLHWICIFGLGDLANMTKQHHLFVNKFHEDYQYLGLDCLEEWIYARSICPLPFDTSYYAQLPIADSKLRYNKQVQLENTFNVTS